VFAPGHLGECAVSTPCHGPKWFDHMCHYWDGSDGRTHYELCPYLFWWLASIVVPFSLLVGLLGLAAR
jgi:hypothetical protein